MSGRLNFHVEAESPGSAARAATFRTPHGEVRTPLFMPVGTRATVRAQLPGTLEASGARVLLANTYHLLLRPGAETFRRFGGIHRFMGWQGSVLTDSGGFQVFSLADQARVSEEGVSFRPHPDAGTLALTPELSIGMQKAIGSDIMMAFDQCVPSTSDRPLALEAMDRTHRWAERSLAARGDSEQALFGIVQGACFEDLRRASARAVTSLPFDGFAIGGLAVGETRPEREAMTELAASLLPRDRPRYLMGVGMPIDLLEAVHRGVDLFDCILPTSLAQQGVAFTSRGRIDLRRGAYRHSEDALDPRCACPACARHSRGYLHHLIKSEEVLGWQLVGAHNLFFYQALTRDIRESILAGRFLELYRERKPVLEARDAENPAAPPRRKRRKPQRPRALGDYEIVVSEAGHASVRQLSSGETMHPSGDPRDEAWRLYVEQPRLAERIAEASVPGELVIWDVGLGAATNAMAAVAAWESAPEPRRALRIVSFERDLAPLRLAVGQPELFAHLRHAAPRGLLERGAWSPTRGGLLWELLEGDFHGRLADASAPDLVFYDPFSFKADAPLWSEEAFVRLLASCRGRAVGIYTYSASTAARAAMLAAGLWVARGSATGPKRETTVALTEEAARSGGFALLGPEWLGRWERSAARIPASIAPELAEGFEQRVRRHPQFAAERPVSSSDWRAEGALSQTPGRAETSA